MLSILIDDCREMTVDVIFRNSDLVMSVLPHIDKDMEIYLDNDMGEDHIPGDKLLESLISLPKVRRILLVTNNPCALRRMQCLLERQGWFYGLNKSVWER